MTSCRWPMAASALTLAVLLLPGGSSAADPTDTKNAPLPPRSELLGAPRAPLLLARAAASELKGQPPAGAPAPASARSSPFPRPRP
jgi:hypothetical protein